MKRTCLDCGKDYEGRFSDNCPVCHSGRAIIDSIREDYSEQILNKELSVETTVVTSSPDIMEPVTNNAIVDLANNTADLVINDVDNDSDTSEPVTKINKSNHRRRGRPPVVTPGQLSLADQLGLSLRKRAVILGVSRMTILRRDREANAQKADTNTILS